MGELMKNTYILIFSLILFTSIAAEGNPIDSDQISQIENTKKNNSQDANKDKTKLQKILSTISSTPAKINSALDWVAKHLDTILTKKGAIKTLLILGPLFTAYCYFFPPEPVKYLIRKIIGSSVSGGSEILVEIVHELEANKDGVYDALTKATKMSGELQGIYEANKEIGRTSGYFDGINNSWWSTVGMLLVNGATNLIVFGVPFALGKYTGNYYIPKHFPVPKAT